MSDPIKGVLENTAHIGVLQELANVLPYLSETEKRLVTYILLHPRDVVAMSVAELASAAGVGEATAFRVFRDLGFGGYSALRARLAEALDHFGESLVGPVSSQWSEGEDAGSLVSGAYVGMRVLLDASAIPQEDLDRAAQAICDCFRLSIAGMGGLSARIAEMAVFGFQRLGVTSMLWIDANVVNVPSNAFQPGDVVIGISHSGENVALAKFMRLALESEATTIAITNYSRSQVARNATIPLITSFREESVENYDLIPRMSQLLLLQLLLDRVRRVRRSETGVVRHNE